MPPKQQSEVESPLSSRESTPLEQGSILQRQVHQDEESTREDLEHLNIKDHTQSEGQEGSSTTASFGKHEEEDVVMQDAPDLKPVVPQGKKKDPVLVLKKVIARRDSCFNLYTVMMNTEASDEKSIKHLGEIRTKLENLNKDISVLKNSVRLSNDKVTASVESALANNAAGSNGGIRLSKQDLPKFQLKSSSTKYFPKDEAYESVNHFLRSFEKVISSSGESIESIWKRYISLTLPYELDNWLSNDVLTCGSWSDVGVVFNKKFGNNAMLKLQSTVEEKSSMPRCVLVNQLKSTLPVLPRLCLKQTTLWTTRLL
ncbi:hypothetical protein HMPREF1544_02646, partial [Mucor circinelloides 1006PhL]